MIHKLILPFAVFAAAILGCAGSSDMPDLGQVHGKVTMDGKPAAGVMVSFQPEDGRPSWGTTDENGEYTLKYLDESGAKVGKNLVTISTPGAGEAPEDCSKSEEGAGAADPIPPRYNTLAVDNPEMTVEVKPGDNTFDFPLTSDIQNTNVGCGNDSAPPELCGEF